MVLGSTDANRVLLVAEHLVMEEEADLNLFYITDPESEKAKTFRIARFLSQKLTR